MRFKKKDQRPFHEKFPEIFQWNIGDEVLFNQGFFLWCFGAEVYYRYEGLVEDSIVYSHLSNRNRLYETKFDELKIKKLCNISLSQRRLKNKMNCDYAKFIKQCNVEYQKLINAQRIR